MAELVFSAFAASLPLPVAVALFFSLLLCVAASFFDLKQNRVPNALNFSGLLAALSIAFLGGIGRALFFQFAASLFFAAVFAFLLFRAGAWRGGDAKFFVALGAFLPLLLEKWHAFSFLEFFIASAIFLSAHLCLAGASLEFRKSAFWAMPAGGAQAFKMGNKLIASTGGTVALAPFLALGFFATVAFHWFLA